MQLSEFGEKNNKINKMKAGTAKENSRNQKMEKQCINSKVL